MKHEGAISEEKILSNVQREGSKKYYECEILMKFTNPNIYTTRQVTYITGEPAVTYYGEHTS